MENKADNSTPFSVETRNVWSFKSTLYALNRLTENFPLIYLLNKVSNSLRDYNKKYALFYVADNGKRVHGKFNSVKFVFINIFVRHGKSEH